ncbi:MAG TPA: NAD(+)/NADH kinase [Ktedonobacterales bacterium]
MSASERKPIHAVGILYKDHNQGAVAMARWLAETLHASGREVWCAAGRDSEHLDGRLDHTDLLIVLGGDGSIISAARACAPKGAPILGVNFGRVGFLTELEPGDVRDALPLYLDGSCWIDERSMLQANLEALDGEISCTALNDIVLARGAEPHVIRIKVWVDGFDYSTTVADGVIISTATGSTAYNLAAGGPILHPQVRSSVLTPIAPHLVADRSLVLEPGAVITLETQAGSDGAMLSADGQMNFPLATGSRVTVTTSAHVTRFLRRRSPTAFYRVLTAKLRDNL